MGIGVQFSFGNKEYVRVPEMILQCGDCEFVINAMYVEEYSSQKPPKFIATYFTHNTIVTI